MNLLDVVVPSRRERVRQSERDARLRRRTLDSSDKGWIFEELGSKVLYILGERLDLSEPQGFDPAWLEQKYVDLKFKLAETYPGKRLRATQLRINVQQGDYLLNVSEVMNHLTANRSRLRDDEPLYELVATIWLDGDKLTLRFATPSFEDDFGFLVPMHPEIPPGVGEGMWYRRDTGFPYNPFVI